MTETKVYQEKVNRTRDLTHSIGSMTETKCLPRKR